MHYYEHHACQLLLKNSKSNIQFVQTVIPLTLDAMGEFFNTTKPLTHILEAAPKSQKVYFQSCV